MAISKNFPVLFHVKKHKWESIILEWDVFLLVELFVFQIIISILDNNTIILYFIVLLCYSICDDGYCNV
jgi:hypothetical protein